MSEGECECVRMCMRVLASSTNNKGVGDLQASGDETKRLRSISLQST